MAQTGIIASSQPLLYFQDGPIIRALVARYGDRLDKLTCAQKHYVAMVTNGFLARLAENAAIEASSEPDEFDDLVFDYENDDDDSTLTAWADSWLYFELPQAVKDALKILEALQAEQLATIAGPISQYASEDQR